MVGKSQGRCEAEQRTPKSSENQTCDSHLSVPSVFFPGHRPPLHAQLWRGLWTGQKRPHAHLIHVPNVVSQGHRYFHGKLSSSYRYGLAKAEEAKSVLILSDISISKKTDTNNPCSSTYGPVQTIKAKALLVHRPNTASTRLPPLLGEERNQAQTPLAIPLPSRDPRNTPPPAPHQLHPFSGYTSAGLFPGSSLPDLNTSKFACCISFTLDFQRRQLINLINGRKLEKYPGPHILPFDICLFKGLVGRARLLCHS